MHKRVVEKEPPTNRNRCWRCSHDALAAKPGLRPTQSLTQDPSERTIDFQGACLALQVRKTTKQKEKRNLNRNDSPTLYHAFFRNWTHITARGACVWQAKHVDKVPSSHSEICGAWVRRKNALHVWYTGDTYATRTSQTLAGLVLQCIIAPCAVGLQTLAQLSALRRPRFRLFAS